MIGAIKHAHRGLSILIVVLIATAVLTPVSALADTNLTIGGQAKIAYANGDDVRLRATPSKSGSIINTISEGSTVDVVDGPVSASDGSVWYQVSFDGDTGYVISDYLALAGGSSSDAPSGPSSNVVGQGLIAGTSGDGVRCRASADGGSSVITVIPEGTFVDLTGSPVGNWQPVNCGGQTGYVNADYVSYDLTGTDNKGDAGRAAAASASATDSSTTAAATGTATVAGTNGDGVRCRSAASSNGQILTVLQEGSSVTLTGDPVGGWQPVICAGQGGFVSNQYLSTGGGSSSGSSSSDSSAAPAVSAASVGNSGTATVSGTNGDGVRCRTGAGTDSSIIVVLSEGTSVALRSGSSGDWQAVVCGGTNGFIFSQYLSTGGSSSSSGGSSSGGSSSGGTGTAYVSGTNGDGVRCRDDASYSGNVISVLAEGTKLTLNGDQTGDWQPVICSGQNGFVFAQYVSSSAPSSSGSSSGGSSSGGSSAPSNSSLSTGDTATVSGTNGDGVRLRSGPSTGSSVITVVAEGKNVKVIDGSTGDWVAVSYSGTSGWINMNYLVAASSGGSSSGGSSSGGGSSSSGGSSSGGLSSGDHAQTTANLNLRYSPSTSSGVAAVAPSGTVVQITGSASSGFYPVDWDGLQGYMSGDYLTATNAALSVRGGSGDPGTSSGGGSSSSGGSSSGGSATGQAIVNYAMQYLGYPYVWATHGPSSFDCSGFTYWVILNTLGIDIGAGTATQIAMGTPVSESQLQPGDLVFFQNTYTWGLSHVGIYIGNGQFIHAENETTGVKISSLSSDYYASRWYGARRLT